MPKQMVRVEGLSELEETLRELPKATGKACIRRALIAAAGPIVSVASDLIRVRRVPNPISVSKIKFTSGKGSAGKQAFAEAMASGATKAEAGAAARSANKAAKESGEGGDVTAGVMAVGPTKRAFYGFEFGTIHQAPHPFMRPSWDTNKMNALQIIQEELKAQIEAARIRLVKKQLRLLALMNK